MSKQSASKLHISIIAISFLVTLLLSSVQAAYADSFLQNIDTKKYPTVKLLVSGTAFDEINKAGQGNQAIEVTENGQTIKDIKINTLKKKPEPLSIVLLIDSSGSMKGKPIEDAKAAANHFIGLLGNEDQISIITFNSKPALLVDYTSDKNKLKKSLTGITASGETAVYDALSLSMIQVSKTLLKQKYVILLSDGADTVSKVTFQSCMDQLKTAKVPLYTIALKSPEFDISSLTNISNQSGGKLLQAINPSELKPFYSRIATQIKNQVEIEYKSPRSETKDIDLDITIGTDSHSKHISTAYPNPNFLKVYEDSKEKVEVKPIVDKWLFRSGILLIAFLASVLLVYGFITTIIRQKSLLQDQVNMYERIWNEPGHDDEKLSPETNPYLSKALGVVAHFSDKRGFADFVKEKLDQAGLPLRPVEYIFFHSLIVIIPSILFQLISGNLPLTFLFILLLTVIPMLIINIIIDRKQKRFNDMLPDTIDVLAGSLRAGYSLLQAIALVADEGKPPVSTEFKRALTESRLGLPIEKALEKMSKRVGSESFYWMVLAIGIQREVGGNLAEVLDIVAKTIRERESLKRHIKALTAEGRLSAYILIALPFFITGILSVMSPSYMMTLFSHILGWIMIFGAGVMMIFGIIWIKKIVSIEV